MAIGRGDPPADVEDDVNQSELIAWETYWNSTGPPRFVAPFLALAMNAEGIVYRQQGPGDSADWHPVEMKGDVAQFVWSDQGFPLDNANPGGLVTVPVVADPTSTPEYLTAIYVERAFKVLGLAVLCETYTSGTLVVKAGVFKANKAAFGKPGLIAAPTAIYAQSATPVTEANFVGPSPIGSEPWIASPGKYWISHLWGTPAGSSFTLRCRRFLYETIGSAQNNYRHDREVAAQNYNTVNFSTKDFTSALPGSAPSTPATTYKMANLLWAFVGEYL